MKEAHVLMKNFQLQTYESQGNFPEIEVTASFIFPSCGKQIANINTEVLKQSMLETLYFQAVKVVSLSSNI